MPSDREVQRFLREAQILCALQHPNIVRFHQFGRSNDQFYIVMDLVAGSDAMRLVEQHGPLGIGRAVRIVCQALDALQYAHDKGYVHRDVKPSNLLVSGARAGGSLPAGRFRPRAGVRCDAHEWPDAHG